MYKYIKNNILYYMIYLIFIIEALINIQSKYLWGDESFTYHLIQHSFIDIINLTAQDVHPFIYYFIAKISVYNINNIFTKIIILKSISVLPYLILLIIGNTYIKYHFSKLTSEIFMLCIISMPLLIDNISQVRMYGWAVLFTTIFYLFIILAYKYNNMKYFLIVSLFALLSSYTHYYALMTIGIIYLIFLVLFIISKKKLKYIIYSMIISIILYLPWIIVLFYQLKRATKSYWSNKIQIKDVIHMIPGSISPVYHVSIFYVFPILLIVLLIIITINKTINKDKMFILNIIVLIIPVVLILLGTLISIIIGHALLEVRYVSPSLGIFWLAISIIISKLNNNHNLLKYLLIFIIVISSIISYVKTTSHTISILNQTNESIDSFNKLPKDSIYIYDNSKIMSSASVYVKNNKALKVPKTDTAFPVYDKVFKNVTEQNSVNISTKDKNIFYVKNINRNDSYNSSLSYKFNKKYKKQKINELLLPNDGDAIVYKITK